MNDGNATWKGTTTGIATYSVYGLDTVELQTLIYQALRGRHNVVFEAKLVDDPSPKPQIHNIAAKVERIFYPAPGGDTMIVDFMTVGGAFFQVTLTKDEISEFEVMM